MGNAAVQAGKRATYPAYKPSGMDWVGDVPEHWEITKLGFHASIKARLGWKGLKADEYVDIGFIFLSTPNIKGREINFANVNYITAERYHESPEIALEQGDVLIAKDGSTLGITNRVKELPAPATVNSSIAVIRPRETLQSDFLYWVLTGEYTQNVIQAMKGGQGVPHLFQADLRKFWVWVPPLDEQKAIAAFLDRETARIDALVEKKRRQIELLQEKRSALISHAVTSGLDPNAPMKDSGIEWLGQVPEHWRVVPMKYLAHIGNGSTPSRENMQFWMDGSFPWLNSSVVNQVRVTEGSDFVTDLALRECHLPQLSPPIVVVGITGEGKTRGLATLVEIECTINQHLAFIKPKNGAADTAYIRNLFLPLYDFLRCESSGGGSTKGAITCELLANIKIPCPPVQEQNEIVDKIVRETSQTDVLLTKVECSLTLLQEFRTALISAAVTGKIDVRGEVI